MKIKMSLYEQVVEITSEYLGPSAQRFIDRQIDNHIHKPPENIDSPDLEAIIDWLVAALAILTNDQKLLVSYETKLKKLTKIHSMKS